MPCVPSLPATPFAAPATAPFAAPASAAPASAAPASAVPVCAAPVSAVPVSASRRVVLILLVSLVAAFVAAGPTAAEWRPTATPALDLADGVAVAADPLEPDVAYALVGQRQVVRSDDQGRTWTTLGFAPQSAPFVFTPEEVERFVEVDRRGSSRERVLVGAYDGLWASEEGGGFLPVGPLRERVRAVALPAGAADRWIVGYDDGGLFRSDDDGLTWRRLPTPVEGGVSVGAFATDPLDADRLLLLLADPVEGSCAPAGCADGLYSSDDGGETWSLLLDGASGDVLHLTPGADAPGGLDEIYVQVDATELAISRDAGASFQTAAPGIGFRSAAFDPAGGQAWLGSATGAISLSLDGGRTWGITTLLEGPVAGLARVGGASGTLLAAVTAPSDDGPGVLVSADGGFVFEAPTTRLDAGAWSTVEPAASTSAIATVGARIVRSTDGGASTELLLDAATGIFLDLDRALSDPSILYAVGRAGGALVWHSDDDGASWSARGGAIDEQVAAHIAISPSDSDVVLVSAGFLGTDVLYRSTDGGESWQQVLETDVFDVVFDPSDASVAYVNGFDSIFRSLDGGVTWMALPREAVALDVDADGALWIIDAETFRLWRSDDRGETFRSVSRPPWAPLSVGLVLDASRAAEGTIVVGTSDDGVLRSLDGGVTWLRLAPGLPEAPVGDVAVADDGTLWAASFGAGLYRGRFDEPPLATTAGRFLATVAWRDFEGGTGTGTAELRTDDTGTFWFFGEDNLELMVKVLDGRGVNGHWWVFYGALSNVELTLTVTDSVTGEVVEYFNPLGTFASDGDVTAFAEPLPSIVGAATPASAPSTDPTTGPVTEPSTKLTPPLPVLTLADRFEVSVGWRDFEGRSGIGLPVPLTPDTGSFWFFGPENLEMMVKIVDGREVNGKFWVFFGSLTNVEFTLRVYDTETETLREYTNPLGAFASFGDVDAFEG